MENATKALLIAAAVLIVILIIALGMRIFSSTNGAAESATKTGNVITQKTNKAADTANTALQGIDDWTGR